MSFASSALVRRPAAPAARPLKLGKQPPPIKSSNTGLPGAYVAPPSPPSGALLRKMLTTTAAEIVASPTPPAVTRPAPPLKLGKQRAPSTGAQLAQQTWTPSAPAPVAPSPVLAPPVYETRAPSASGGGGVSPFLETFGSAGPSDAPPEDVPVAASFSLVSGDVPDGVVYLIVGSLIAAGAYAIWRRSKKGRR